MTLDFNISIGDVILLAGFLWQYFQHRKQTDENTKDIKALKERRNQHWDHIQSMSKTIAEWKGNDDAKGLIPQLEETVAEIKVIVSGLSDSNMKRSG